MEEKIITTPNGYSVHIRADLTYGQYEDLQSIMGENIKIDPATGKPQAIDFKLINEVNKKAAEMLVVKIEKDGEVFTGNIRDLPLKDGKVIMDEIDRIMKSANPDEKKGV